MVRNDYFNGMDAEELARRGDYSTMMSWDSWHELRDNLVPHRFLLTHTDITDTCNALWKMFYTAARASFTAGEWGPGGACFRLDDEHDDKQFDDLIGALAEAHVEGAGNVDWGSWLGWTSGEAAYYITNDDVNALVTAAIDGGVVEMLDAWIAGVPLEHILAS